MTLASSSERSRLRWNHVATGTNPCRFLLSWPCPLPPLRRLSPAASTPGGRCPPKRMRVTFGSGIPTPDVPFRPRGLAPPRRLSPQQACGFVAPRYRPWGSSRFRARGSRTRLRRDESLEATAAFPRRGHYPSKGSPRRQHAPRHRGRLPSCRSTVRRHRLVRDVPLPGRRFVSRASGAAGFKALLHRRIRCRLSAVADRDALAPPMGLCPLQGPSGSAAEVHRRGGAPVDASAPLPPEGGKGTGHLGQDRDGDSPRVSWPRESLPRFPESAPRGEPFRAAGVCPGPKFAGQPRLPCRPSWGS